MTTSMQRQADGSGAMFDRIAVRYDRVNRLMSFGLDRGWRKLLVESIGTAGCGEVLDVATGTADVAIAVAKAHPNCRVVGVDPSTQMLGVGNSKIDRARLDDRIELIVGDAQRLEFEDDRFAAATIAFGIRNVPDRLIALEEMRRVVRPGGVISVLELGEPRGPVGALARFHVHRVVPLIGALISGRAEYRYLEQSIARFPPAAEFAQLMERAGLEGVFVRTLGFGAVHLYTGRVG